MQLASRCSQSGSILVQWGSMISRCLQSGLGMAALECFENMQANGILPDRVIFTSVLRACVCVGSIKYALEIHDQIIRIGLHTDVNISSSLIVTYAKFRCLKESRNVFNTTSVKNVVLWGSMMTGYIEHGFGHDALSLYQKMQDNNIKPDRVIYLCLLKACGNIEAVRPCKLLHEKIIRAGMESDVALASTLLDVYAKCSCLQDAEEVFNGMPQRNVVSWNALMTGHVEQGNCLTAMRIFKDMQQTDLIPTKVTFLCIIRACSSVKALGLGKEIHNQLIISGFDVNLDVGNALIDMYAKCKMLEDARKVFGSLSLRDHVSWGSMVAGYVQCGHGMLALELFESMQGDGIEPDKALFSSILKACGIVGDVGHGKVIHDRVKKSGYEHDTIVGNTIIDMYAKCGCLAEAREAFEGLPTRTQVSWGALIAGYTQHGQGLPALEIFYRMQREGITPNKTIFPCVLKACSTVQSWEDGKHLHDQLITSGTEIDVTVGNALMDMYIKCERLEDAIKVFDGLQIRDVISWSTMMAGYVQDGQGLRALDLFTRLHKEAVITPDRALVLCVSKACGNVGALKMGMLVHHWIVERDLGSDLAIGNTILDTYTKCKGIEEARNVFGKIAEKNVVSWNAMIAGYAELGFPKSALQCYEEMLYQGMKPDGWTFTSVFVACSEAALVEEGYRYFKSMIHDHGIGPSIEHFNCMIDLLGRAGLLSEARKVPQTMPFRPDIATWMSLLTGCRMYGDLELGRRCLDEMSQLEPDSASMYTLLSNMFGEFGLPEDAKSIQGLKKCSSAWKKPGRACIEVGHTMQEFVVGEGTDLGEGEMHDKLRRLARRLKDQGFAPKLELILEPMETQEAMAKNLTNFNKSQY